MEDRVPISVVVTAYNHGSYIGKAVESVLGQTFGDFEMIVFDDGSPDDTRDVVAAFKDNRIRYYYQTNSGLPACGRNRGIELARGAYISLMDGDDFWHKDKLKESKKALEENPETALVCHNEAIVRGEEVVRHSSYGPYVADMYHKLLFDGNCLHTSAVTIRRGVFFEDGFAFSEDKRLYTVEDYEYWLRLSRKYRFFFIPEVLGYCRISDTGAYLGNAAANSANMLALLDREFGKMAGKTGDIGRKIRMRRSAVMAAAGRMLNHKSDFAESRRWYSKAINEYPLNYKAYIGFLAAAAGLRMNYR